MKLTAEETKKIDEALVALKRSMKEEMGLVPAVQRGEVKVDDEFLKRITDLYFSTSEGLVNLLLDSGILRDESCTCGVSCANPCRAASGRP
jgi:predicted nucleotidyltransferase